METRDDNSLLTDIGGLDGCRRLSAAFYVRAPRDPVLKKFFPKPPHCAIESLAQFVAQILGGPSGYSAMRPWLSLTDAHARFKIGDDERRAWLDNMAAAMVDIDVPPDTRDSLNAFFDQSSGFLVNSGMPPQGWRHGTQERIAQRWSIQEAIDTIVGLIRGGDIAETQRLTAELVPNLQHDRPALANVLALIGSTNDPAAIDFVAAILEGERDLLTEQYYYGSILHHAASTTASTFVDRLLSLGANPNLRDKFGHTPLYSTCNGAGDVTIARALIAAGADVDAQDYVKRCAPLHMAARRGHVDVAAVLLGSGANVEVKDINGQTPLRRAVNCGKVDVARLLIARGADLDAVDKRGVSPRQAAEKSGRIISTD